MPLDVFFFFRKKNPIKYSLKSKTVLDIFVQFHNHPLGVLSYPQLHQDVLLLPRVNSTRTEHAIKKILLILLGALYTN